MSIKAKCGCKSCKQWQTNHNETDFNCISFGFAVRILKNMLECDDDVLSTTQKEAIKLTIETVKERDETIFKEYLNGGLYE